MTVYIEVGIVILMAFLLLSLLVTSVTELIASLLKMRSAILRQALADIIDDEKLRQKFYSNRLLLGVKSGGQDNIPGPFIHPSYLAPNAFARAILLAVSNEGGDDKPLSERSMEELRTTVGLIKSESVKKLLLGFVDGAEKSVSELELEIAAWYDSVMKRVSGYFKRRQQVISFLVGLSLAAALNVDVIHLAQNAYGNDAVRAQLVANAEIFAAAQPGTALDTQDAVTKIGKLSDDLKSIDLGWSGGFSVEKAVPHIPGWLLAALAAMLGAPFWFDLLSRFVQLRGTGGKPSAAAGAPPGTQGSV